MPEFYPFNFGGLPKEFSELENSRYVVLPIPYETTTTYGKGTKKAPKAIIEASRNMELYDEEILSNPYLKGICTLDDLLFESILPEDMVETIFECASDFISRGKTLISLGGEHSISYPLFLAHSKFYENLGVLQIDAHLDLRESYEGTPFSHASVMRRIYEKCQNVVQVGIRSLSKEEGEFIKSDYRGKIFWAKECYGNIDWIEKVVESLPQNVYLTFDVDGLDPSIMPSTGTPEPGGLNYYESLHLLRRVANKKNIVGMDFTEFIPSPPFVSPDFLISKIIYKTIGYIEEKSR